MGTDKRFFDEMDTSSYDPVAEAPPPGVEGAESHVLCRAGPTGLRECDVQIREPGADPFLPLPTTPETVNTSTSETAPLPEPQGPRLRFMFAANGPYLAQIAAVRSEEAAESIWNRVTSSSPDLYDGATKNIQRADLGAEGVFYRLRVGPFADRSEASAFCDAVKEAGANCIVVNR